MSTSTTSTSTPASAQSRFTVFGHDQCGFCRRAKQLLSDSDLPFRYVDIHDEMISKADLSKTVGHEVTTVPQIFHGQNYVGGFDALQKYLVSDIALANTVHAAAQ